MTLCTVIMCPNAAALGTGRCILCVSVFQTCAELGDPLASLSQVFVRSGIADAEIRAQPEGRTKYHRNPCFFQQSRCKHFVILDHSARAEVLPIRPAMEG